MKGACIVAGCRKSVIARGLCMRHYQRQRRGQELSPPKREKVTNAVATLVEDDLAKWLSATAQACELPVSALVRNILRDTMSRDT